MNKRVSRTVSSLVMKSINPKEKGHIQSEDIGYTTLEWKFWIHPSLGLKHFHQITNHQELGRYFNHLMKFINLSFFFLLSEVVNLIIRSEGEAKFMGSIKDRPQGQKRGKNKKKVRFKLKTSEKKMKSCKCITEEALLY